MSNLPNIRTNAISYTGRVDRGAGDRARKIARALAAVAAWNGLDDIVIFEPYEIEDVLNRLDFEDKDASALVKGTHYEIYPPAAPTVFSYLAANEPPIIDSDTERIPTSI